jgi:DNA polymerase III sliding clamp (beta) subunit (PCNA family)
MVRIAAAGESSFVPVAAEIFLDNAWRGVFPNFRQIIPSYCEHEVTMKIEDLRAVMKGWDKKVTVMHMNFNVDAVSGKGCVEIYSKAAGKDGPDVIALVTNLLCESLPNGDGTALKIAFNPEFLFDMVRALPIRKGHVTFRMNGSLTPVVIKHTAATYLLMPLNSI